MQLTPVVENITPYTESIEIPNENFPEVSTLTQRGKELTNHVGTVLGESVAEADAEQQPLHERAIEYGQYIYCKGIVEEYENNHYTSKPSEWSLDQISKWRLSLLRNVTTRQNKVITVESSERKWAVGERLKRHLEIWSTSNLRLHHVDIFSILQPR